MKCKMCGKEINNDSLFCKYCGQKQQEKLPKLRLKEYQYAIIVAWLILNLYCWLTFTDPFAGRFLFPIQKTNVDYYDISEFVLYGLGGVAIMVGIWLFKKK